MRPYPLPVVLALLLLPAWSLCAEEPAAPTAAQRLEAALAGLPAPSNELGFSFEGTLNIQGNRLGSALFRAVPLKDETAGLLWELTEKLSFKAGSMDMQEESVMTLDAHLRPLRGRVIEIKQGVKVTYDWRRTATCFEITITPTEGEASSERIEFSGYAAPSVVVALLFTRLLGPDPATYEMTTVDINQEDDDHGDEGEEVDDGDDDEDDDEDGDEDEEGDEEDDDATSAGRLSLATLTIQGQGKWKGVNAYVVAGKRKNGSWQWGHDAATRDLLGMTLTMEGGQVIEIVPASAESAAKPVDFGGPAKDARAAAAQALIALASADVALLTQVVDWPAIHAEQLAIHEAANAQNPDAEPFPDEEGFREQFLQGMAQRASAGQVFPREMIEGALRAQLDQLTVTELEGGNVRVTFPAAFRDFSAIVAKRGEQWFLVSLPPRQR